jgi:hypothetical protein
MDTRAITIPVDMITATKYAVASREERRKVQLLVQMLFQDTSIPADIPLEQVMDEMSDEAQANGLTPAILEHILHDTRE